MFTEIVRFQLPPQMSRDDVVALYEKSAEIWRATPELLHKSYLYDPETGFGGGVYLWHSLDDAKRLHGSEFIERIAATFGSVPTFEYFETPVVVDNVAEPVG